MSSKYVIVDDSHGEQFGSFDSFEAAWAELRRLADIAWNVEPNLTPCSSWETCSREYEIVEFDVSSSIWLEVNRVRGVEIGSKGVIWAASAPRAEV